uniref:Ig-like domain-containing protein n=1 Tax=Parascaris equorum TaxID=6256 RepID=A0A914S5U3_PAREQ
LWRRVYSIEEQTVLLLFCRDFSSVSNKVLFRFEVQPQDRDVYRGQSVAFSCILDSHPAAHIEWYHNNKLLDDGRSHSFNGLCVVLNANAAAFDDSITIFAVSSTLEISNVQPRHEGSYKCVAKNGDKSRSSRDAKLTISPENNGFSVGNQFTEPSFVLEPRGEVLQEGESIVLECLANGWPRPEVRWLKGSQAVSADGDRVLTSLHQIRRMGSSSLLILKASPSDAGVYTCRASNTQDSVDSSTTIQVKGQSLAPEITRRPKDVVAQETTDVELDCAASGKPGAVVSWYKNGEAIIASEYFVVGYSAFFIFCASLTECHVECVVDEISLVSCQYLFHSQIEGNRLRILGLVRNDQGVYQCVADNDAGSAQASAQLIVDSAGMDNVF